MSAKVIICKGLPCSGKSTWAKEQVRKGGGDVKRVNKDELRAMMDLSEWSWQNEKLVLQVRDLIITKAVRKGYTIIVDDTNLNPKMERGIRTLVGPNVTVEVIFFDITPEVAKEREAKRRETDPCHIDVPDEVIDKMWNAWQGGWKDADCMPSGSDSPAVVQNPSLPKAVIVDIDGTLAHMGDRRGAFEWDKVLNDEVDPVLRMTVNLYREAGYQIVLVSGRDGICRDDTITWLQAHEIHFDALFMRPEGDMRKDFLIKREIFMNDIVGRWFTHLVFDDRNQTVEEWRALGLKCFQVEPGDF